MQAGFIREVFHPKWLANIVTVKKKKISKWRMFVDFTNLNKACPNDSFPLPIIDQLEDSTARHLDNDEADHLDNLKETFNILRKYKMKLNLSNCVLAVSSGKFLGFMIS